MGVGGVHQEGRAVDDGLPRVYGEVLGLMGPSGADEGAPSALIMRTVVLMRGPLSVDYEDRCVDEQSCRVHEVFVALMRQTSVVMGLVSRVIDPCSFDEAALGVDSDEFIDDH